VSVLRSFLRRFRESIGKADIGVWPVSFRLDREEFDRPEPRIKAGKIEVRR
jgi:hypothetical protein